MLPLSEPDRIRIAFDDHRLVANAGLVNGLYKTGREALGSIQSLPLQLPQT